MSSNSASTTKPATTYTEEDVAKHNTRKDCWIIIGNDKNGGPKVYDVTSYLDDHPGGSEVILDFAGKEADDMFEDIGHSKDARNKMKEFYVGDLKVSNADKPKKSAQTQDVEKKGGLNPLAIVFLLIAIAVGLYFSNRK